MTPSEGVYLGSVFIQGSKKAYLITVTLKVDPLGPLSGGFEIQNPEGWTGPPRGAFREGAWTPYGTLHLEEEEDAENKGTAVFDGFFTGSETTSAFIWGRLFAFKMKSGVKTVTQIGTMALSLSAVLETVDGEGPWGN